MPSWNPNDWPEYAGFKEGTSINAPVTIEGRDRGCQPQCEPQINMKEYVNYLVRKILWEQEGNGPGPQGQFSQNMRFAAINETSDSSLQVVGTALTDGLYVLSADLVCKKADGAAGTQTLLITYFDVLAGATNITLTQTLTALGQAQQVPLTVCLLAGSAVTVSCAQSGTYGAAAYDAFVGLQKFA